MRAHMQTVTFDYYRLSISDIDELEKHYEHQLVLLREARREKVNQLGLNKAKATGGSHAKEKTS